MQAFLVCVTALALTSCTSRTNYPSSNHYDGKKFHNTEFSGSATTLDVLRLWYELLSSTAWRNQSVEKGTPDLHRSLLPGQLSVTFINHSSFLIRGPGLTLLADPVLSERASPFTWIGPKRQRAAGIEFDELPKIDVVIISHNHYDHMDIPTLKRLSEKFSPLFLVPLGDRQHLTDEGIENVRELDWWDSVALRSGERITFAPAQHYSSRSLFDKNESLWGSYMIQSGQKRLFFAGDSGYASHFREVRERLGSPDVALLPIGAYEPYWFMKPIHMNPADAVRAHNDLGAKKSVGMHFGTFKLTTEAVDQPSRDLSQAVQAMKLDSHAFEVPLEGRTLFF